MYDDPRELEIWRLERQLSEAREAVLCLLPRELVDLFEGFEKCESLSEYYDWNREVIAEVLSRAAVKELYGGKIAYCPLCHGGSSGPYGGGFKYPLGLERHLTGYGNVKPCPVLSIALRPAREKKSELYQQEREAAANLKDERRLKETLYRISPFEDPVLIDEGLFLTKVRDSKELNWTIDRLKDLGFRQIVDERVRSYCYENETYLVYADPRATKKIEFRAFKKPLPKEPRRNSRSTIPNKQFHILDSWKNNLKAKFLEKLS